MMTEKQFWALIEDSKLKSYNVVLEQADILEEILKNLTLEEIYDFDQYCIAFYQKTYRKDIWRLAIVLNGVCDTEEDFRAFSGWLISRGEAVFTETLKNPDNIVTEIGDLIEAELEELFYVAQNAYDAKHDSQKLDYFERYRSWNEVEIHWDEEFWEEELNDEDLIKQFPQTTKALGWYA